MAKTEKLIGIYRGAGLNAPASNLIQMPSLTGTITEVYLDGPEVSDGDAEFELLEDGVSVTTITIADTTSNENVTGLSFSSTTGKVLSLNLLAPIPAGLPDPPYSLIVTVEVTETHVALTGAQTVAGVKTFSSDPIIPDEAYGVGWNGSLEPPTKNAVYDKIETLGGGGSTAADISIDEIGTATYDTVADHLKIITSPGWISGGTITDSGSAEIDVAAGTGFIRATDGDTDTLYSFDWAGVTNQAITADSIRYVGVQYNAGSPQVFIKTTDAFDYDTEFPLGVVVNEGGTLYIANRPWKTADALADIMERFDSVALVTRDNRTGGLILGNTGTRNVTVSAGALLSRLSEYSVAAIDTAAASTFDAYYRNGSGGWTKQAAQTQWNNSNYDDGDGTLGSLTSNRYTSRWFYLTLSGALVMVYGQAEYQSLANALNEGAPSTVPNRLTAAGILIGRIIAQQGTDTPGVVQTAFTTSFSSANVTAFSQLSGTVSTSQIADEAVTLAKIADASANSKLLGSGDAGAGAPYVEITLGTNLSMTGTTLSASLAGGAVDTANSPNAGEWAKFTDADTIEGRTNSELLGDLGITASVAELNILDGVTASASELNALDGITATVTELNYTDGVTSAIQTQLDAKAPKVNPQLALDASQASDDNYAGITIDGRNNSGGVTQWDAVYLNGSSEFVLADANGSGTYPAVGLAVATVATGNATTVITHGVVRNDAWTWTVGGVIYLSTTAGGLTQTAPSASGDKVQVMGIAISADEMLVNPSMDYLTIT